MTSGIYKIFLGLHLSGIILMLSGNLYAQQIDKATGGESISADNFASGTFTSLSGPVITETSAGQLPVGFIKFTAPNSFEWDTTGTDPSVSITLAPGSNGTTKLQMNFSSRTTSKIIFEITQSSVNPPVRPARATFSGFRIRPTKGTLPNSGIITNTGGSGPAGQTSYGDINMVAGAASKIRVETRADGLGVVVPVQDITAGNSLSTYSVSRDQFNNYLQNIAADSWSLVNKTSLDTSPLTSASDNKSATFKSDKTGSARIQAVKSGLTSTGSGTLTVQPDSPTSLFIQTQPSSTATAGQAFPQQPVVHVRDVFGNRVTTNNSIAITAARKDGTGTLQGTKKITVQQGAAAYSNLKHNIADDISIEFSASALPSVVSNAVTINPASASKLLFSVQPPNGSKNTPLSPAPEVQISDTFGNAVSQSGTAVVVSKISGPGDISSTSDTSDTTNSAGKAAFDNLKFTANGDYKIKAQSSGLTSVESNQFTILDAGVLAKFDIEAQGGGGIVTQTAGQTFIIKITAKDGTGAILDGNGQPAYNEKAFITSAGNTGFGLNDSTINFTDGVVTDTVSLEVAGDFTISASAKNSDGTNITSQSNSFVVNPASASPDSSTIRAVPETIVADGSSTSLITVQLKDQFGNNLVSGGNTVSISTSAGTMTGTISENGDGTYTQNLQSSTTAGTATISATVNGNAITSGDATVTFAPGGLDHFNVGKAGGGTIGTQTAGQSFTIRITAKDVHNNTVTPFNGSVDITSNKNISSGSGSFSLSNGVLDNHSITITGAGQNSVTITATNTGGTQTGTSSAFTVNPGPTSAATTLITPNNRFIENTGTSTTDIIVQAKDQFGNNRLTGGDAVTLSTDAGSFTNSVTDNGDGTYSRTLQSTTTVTTATITGTINATNIIDDAKVSFAEFNTWEGGNGPRGKEWNRSKNWTLGVPTSQQAVIIPTTPSGASQFPIITSNPTVAFLDIKSNATVNVDPTYSITITSDVLGDGALIVDTGTATIGGNITVANLSAGTSTVNLNGSDTQTIPSSLVTNILNIQNTSTEGIISSGYVNADARMTIDSSSTLTMQSGSILDIFNNVTGGGSLIGDNSTFEIGGDVSLTTVDASTSDVIFDGTAAQSISTIRQYRNLTVSNTTSGGVTLTDTTSVSQTVTINSGATLSAQENLTGATLSAAGGTLRLAKDVSFTNVSPAPSTVEFFGVSSQTIGSFNPFNNLTVNKSSNRVVSNDDVIVNGTLTLSSGDLVLGPGTNLLASNRSLSGGIIRFQLELPSQGWYALSAPVSSTYGDFLDSIVTQGYPGAFYDSGTAPNDTLQPNVLYYDETFTGTDNQRWRAIGGALHTIEEARGHFVYMFGDVPGDSRYNNAAPNTLEVGGAEFAGDGSEVNFDVTYTAGADTGWNLVSNPYGATINWDDEANWTKTNMDNTVYIWDHSANGGNGDYLIWNGFTGSLNNGLIAPFQAFWVKADTANPVLKVKKEAKTVGGVFRKERPKNQKRQENPPVIELKLKKQNLETRTYITFSEEASRWKDGYDGYRLVPFSDTYLELFSSFGDGTQLTINNLPRKFGKEIGIPLYVGGFRESEPLGGTFTLSWPKLDQIPREWSLILVDKQTEKEVDLQKESFYSFNLRAKAVKSKANGSPGRSYTVKTKSRTEDARFVLRITPGGDAGDLPKKFQLNQNYPNPFNPSTTIQFGVPVQSRVKLTVYDILGRKIAVLADRSYEAGFHKVSWNAGALASGVYLYVFQTEGNLFTKKMTFVK